MKTVHINVDAADGCPLRARLCLPDSGTDRVVVYVNGSGPTTYLQKAAAAGLTFNYFDLLADGFTSRGVGFCSYSQRGVTGCETPPLFYEVDAAAYSTYLPHNSVSDVEKIIREILAHCNGAKIILLGWSEGTILAPMVVKNGSVDIHALMLSGYCNDNLRDILVWQLSGNSTLMMWRRYFDHDRLGYITRESFIEDRYSVVDALNGSPIPPQERGSVFDSIDLDRDGRLTAADFKPQAAAHLQGMLDAIERGDDEWLRQNHGVLLTTGWFREHFALPPNSATLPSLYLPIHIFSGEFDFMTPPEQARAIADEFSRLGKRNLTLHCFKNHDHGMNFIKKLLKGEDSEGMKAIYETAVTI